MWFIRVLRPVWLAGRLFVMHQGRLLLLFSGTWHEVMMTFWVKMCAHFMFINHHAA